MPSSPPDETAPLQIRCPSCSQRFTVAADLMNRTVECGSCEHRFRIEDDVIIKARRYYPGERRDAALDRFQRVPMAGGTAPPKMQTAQYAAGPDPASWEPPSPQRVIAGAIGVTAMILMALLLIFGATRGGTLDGMPLASRLVMAAFAALLGGALLWYANPRGRAKALAVALVFGLALLSLPFAFPEGSQPLRSSEGPLPQATVIPIVEEVEEDPSDALREEIGTGPLDAENERLAKEGSDKVAIGVWLRDLSEFNRLLVDDYLHAETSASRNDSHIYPRHGGDYLMVLSGLDPGSLTELGAIAGRLGRTVAIHEDIKVVEVRVDNQKLVEPPLETLKDKSHPQFYAANKNELESIDPERAVRAARRLAEAEPNLFRSDISRRLFEMLKEGKPETQAVAARGLITWAEDLEEAAAAAASAAAKIHAEEEEVPRELLELAVAGDATEVIPILDDLWSVDPPSWESLFVEFGPAIEPVLLAHFPGAVGGVKLSAIKLLGQVGGKQSLPVLNAAEADADRETSVLISRAKEAIQARTGG